MSDDLVRDDAALAVAAAAAGATVVRDRYGASLERFEKAPGDFATDADLAAERAILDVLRAARPGDAFLGEESGQSGDAGAERTWLIDPLCGTLNYATGGMLVAVNVALRVGDDVTAAAVADPFSGEVFWTDGDGAYVRRDDAGGAHSRRDSSDADRELSNSGINSDDNQQPGDTGAGSGPGSDLRDGGDSAGIQHSGSRGPGRRGSVRSEVSDEKLNPSTAVPLVDINLDPPYNVAPWPASRLIADPALLERFRPRVVSTTLAVTWVAAGRRAAYVTGGDLRDNVHFAAGIALCRAAGCVVTGIEGQPLHTGAGGLLVAADHTTHAALLELLNKSTD